MCDDLPWFNKANYFKDGKIQKAKSILTKGRWIDTNGNGIREKKRSKRKLQSSMYPETKSAKD
jgi:hypothetical protein